MTSASAAPSRPDCILRLRQVCRVTGLCRSNVYLLQAQNRFPAGIKISIRAVGWLESEAQAWASARRAERTPACEGGGGT